MKTALKNYVYENNNYNLEIKYDSFNYKELPVNIEKVRQWCKEGCSNYNTNGGCPPFSPTASDVLKDKTFILLFCKIKTSQVKASSLQDKMDLIQKILYSFVNALGYKVSDLYNIEFLNAGQCTACDICTIHSGCKNPIKRVHCITGLGIMLGDTIEKLFEEKLVWCTGNEEPLQITKIMGFVSEGKSSFLLKKLSEII
jgi:predicted metal-binding protein